MSAGACVADGGRVTLVVHVRLAGVLLLPGLIVGDVMDRVLLLQSILMVATCCNRIWRRLLPFLVALDALSLLVRLCHGWPGIVQQLAIQKQQFLLLHEVLRLRTQSILRDVVLHFLQAELVLVNRDLLL